MLRNVPLQFRIRYGSYFLIFIKSKCERENIADEIFSLYYSDQRILENRNENWRNLFFNVFFPIPVKLCVPHELNSVYFCFKTNLFIQKPYALHRKE